MTDPEKSKETMLAYLDMAFSGKRSAEAVERYGGPYYIQHNPQSSDGFEGFVRFVEGFAEQFLQSSLEIKRTVAEGDLVVTRNLFKTSPEDSGTAVAGFFRLEDDKIVEHWDVSHPVPGRGGRSPDALIDEGGRDCRTTRVDVDPPVSRKDLRVG